MQLIYGAIEVPAKVSTFFVLHWIGHGMGHVQAMFLITTGALVGINVGIPFGTSLPAFKDKYVQV